jgi:DNA-binding transcriptional MerR regulator
MLRHDKSASLSMKDLSEATGTHRQTVHNYLRQGVLPPPISGAGTPRARYGNSHIELLRTIRRLRDEEGLSLEAIRRRFEHAHFDPSQVEAAAVRPPASLAEPLQPPEMLDEEQLLERAQVRSALFRQLAEAGVLAEVGGDVWSAAEAAQGGTVRYGTESVDVLQSAARLLELGISEDTLNRIARGAKELAWIETESLLKDVATVEQQRDTLASRLSDRYLGVTRLIGAVRAAALASTHWRLLQLGSRARRHAAESIYAPSELFVTRFRLEEVLTKEMRRASQRPKDPRRRLAVGRLLFGLGRYQEATEWLTASVRLDSSQAETYAYLGTALAMGGQIADGVEACRQAVAINPASPRAHAFFGAMLLLQGVSGGGAAGPTDLVAEGMAEVHRSRKLIAADARESVEAQLARGRVVVAMPRELDTYREGLDDLREVLRLTQVENEMDEVAGYPGATSLYRIHALYYLGVASLEEGEIDDGTALLKECIALDPASATAELAYKHLGKQRG